MSKKKKAASKQQKNQKPDKHITAGKQRSSGRPSYKKRTPRRYKLALCLTGIAGALALLAVAELSLRGLGVAEPPPLLLPLYNQNGKKLVTNNQLFPLRFFFKRYEDKYAGVGQMNLQAFWTPKPANTLRVLFAGTSTVQGFPHPRNLNSSSFLRAYLRDLLPEKNVQVINLGTTAIASFAVRKILKQASALDPDVIVVYTAHNEFFGAYGVASLMRAASGPAGSAFHYWFNQLRLVRLFSSPAEDQEDPEVTEKDLMEIMAESEYIGPEDSRRQGAFKNLKVNLGAMAETARSWGVPLILCTVASNHKDLYPVRSLSPPFDTETGYKWQNLVDTATPSSLAKAAKLYPHSAYVRFMQGRFALRKDRFKKARELFQKAVDLDAMPWRAPSEANRIIRQLASRPNVFLADVEKAFRREGPHGIPGWELFADHVHPNVKGQAIMARAVLSAINEALPGLKLETEKLKDRSYYRNLLGYCPALKYHLVKVMEGLFGKQPLRKNNKNALGRIRNEINSLNSSMASVYKEAYKFWRKLPRGMTKRPLVMVCADGFQQRTPSQAPDFAEAARLFYAGVYGTPPYTSLRVEAVERYLANKVLSRQPSLARKEDALASELLGNPPWRRDSLGRFRKQTAQLRKEAIRKFQKETSNAAEVLGQNDRKLAEKTLQMAEDLLKTSKLKDPDYVRKLMRKIEAYL